MRQRSVRLYVGRCENRKLFSGQMWWYVCCWWYISWLVVGCCLLLFSVFSLRSSQTKTRCSVSLNFFFLIFVFFLQLFRQLYISETKRGKKKLLYYCCLWLLILDLLHFCYFFIFFLLLLLLLVLSMPVPILMLMLMLLSRIQFGLVVIIFGDVNSGSSGRKKSVVIENLLAKKKMN